MKTIITSLILLGLCSCQHALQRKPLEMYEYCRSVRKEMQKLPDFSEQKYKDAIDLKYNSVFKGQKPATEAYTDETLKQAFAMYDTLSFYTLENRYLSGLESVFTELRNRGLERNTCKINRRKSTCVEDMFSAYINQGELLSAKRLQNEYHEVFLSTEQVPDTREPAEYLGNAWNLYSVSAEGKYFNLQPVDLKTKPVMVAIMSTDCHFSRHILQSLLADPELKRDFENYAIIVLPINASLSFIPEVVNWNSKNPKLPFRIYSARQDLRHGWEKFDFTSIPQFYFLKGGETVEYIGGWGPNDEEFTAKLYNGFKKLKTDQQ